MPELFTNQDVRRLLQAAGATRACELGYKILGVDAAVEAAEAAQEAELTKLNIYRASLADDATVAMMPRLGRNTCITELSLGYNAIGDAGAAAIGRMLCNNSVLRKLLLHQNRIGNAGAAALASALVDNCTLQTLSLANNAIGEDGVAALAATLQDDNWSLTSCNLGHNNVNGDTSQRGGKSELVRLLEIAAACERNKDSAKVADGMARRQRRRLEATRAANERKKQELAEVRSKAQGIGSDLKAKMARLLAPPPSLVHPEPKPEPEPEPEPKPEPEPEPELEPERTRTVAGRWRAMVPRQGGDTAEFMLKLEIRPDFSDASDGTSGDRPVGVTGAGERVGYSMEEGRVKRWQFDVTGGRWDARCEGGEGKLQLQLRFKDPPAHDDRASLVKARGRVKCSTERHGGQLNENVEEWEGTLPMGSDVAVLTCRCSDFISQDSFTLRRMESTDAWECAQIPISWEGTPPRLKLRPQPIPQVALQATPPKACLPKLPHTPQIRTPRNSGSPSTSARVTAFSAPKPPGSTGNKTGARKTSSWRMPTEPLPSVLPTPRTYRELVCELREALPQRLAHWVQSNAERAPGLAAMLEQGEDPSTVLVQDPHAGNDRSKPATAPVQYTVGGKLVHFKVNRGVIQVRGGGGYTSMEEWLQRTAPTLERRLGMQRHAVAKDADGPSNLASSPKKLKKPKKPKSSATRLNLTPQPPSTAPVAESVASARQQAATSRASRIAAGSAATRTSRAATNGVDLPAVERVGVGRRAIYPT